MVYKVKPFSEVHKKESCTTATTIWGFQDQVECTCNCMLGWHSCSCELFTIKILINTREWPRESKAFHYFRQMVRQGDRPNVVFNRLGRHLFSVKARPQFFDEKYFVNEAVKFPVAFLENEKLALIEKIFCHRAILKNGYGSIAEYLGSAMRWLRCRAV